MGLDSLKNEIIGYGNAPLLCWVYEIHEHNRESYHLLNILVLQMNCPDSSPRNKAKNALSLAVPISPGKAGAKIGKIWFVQGKKCENLAKYLFNFMKMLNFAGKTEQICVL